MGFNIKTTELLINSKKWGIDFSNPVTIGRQKLHGFHLLFERLFKKYNLSDTLFQETWANDRYCERFLEELGAKRVISMDASDYEHASIIHDMNDPITREQKNKYSVVIDGGSLEHVFNFPVAIKNCMEMVKPGGHFIGAVPANNFLGHGFYQFSPELFYRVFSFENGFRIEKMILYFNEPNSPLYEVCDPLTVKSRVTLKNNKESYLFIVARKEKEGEIFLKHPQQSDYQFISWDKNTKTTQNDQKSGLVNLVRKIIPQAGIIYLLKLRKVLSDFSVTQSPVGTGKRSYFKRMRL